MKTTVIYHRADFDGIFCREIAKLFLPEDTEFIGWDYGDPEPEVAIDMRLYILDLSVPGLMAHPNLTWIDHHKSAMQKYIAAPYEWSGAAVGRQHYCIDGVAASRLAWQWFAVFEMHDLEAESHAMIPGPQLPHKQLFIDRKVSEPWAVRLAGEYDIWDKRDPDAELFQHGLRSRDLTNDWRWLLSADPRSSIEEIEALIDVGHRDLLNPDGTVRNPIVLGLLEAGRGIQYAQTKQNESVIREIGFTFQWEGLTFLGCNASRYNSHLFTAGLKPEHDGCFGFKWTGRDWSVSLYGVPGKPDMDLSTIAVKYGGGGHKQACGFRTKQLPFLT